MKKKRKLREKAEERERRSHTATDLFYFPVRAEATAKIYESLDLNIVFNYCDKTNW